MRTDMLNSATVESEDSLSDEYTVVVEEVHTEDILTESFDGPMPKNSIPKADEIDEETSVSLDDDLNDTARLITKTYSPGAFSNTSEFEEAIVNITSTDANKLAVNEKSETSNLCDLLNKTEADLVPKNGKVDATLVYSLNGTIVHRTNEHASENISFKKIYPSDTEKNDSSEANHNHTLGYNYNKKISSEVYINGVLPRTQDTAAIKSSDTSGQVLTNLDNSTGNYNLSETAKESSANGLNNRKRSSEYHEVNGSAFESDCDNDIHLVSDIKKRKILDSTDNSVNSTSSGIPDSEELTGLYSTPKNSKDTNFEPSQNLACLPNCINSDKVVTLGKKNIARKHTSSMSVMKTMKDVELTVLAELSKQEKNITNGCVENEDLLSKKECQDQSTSTDPQYRVNFSMDSLCNNSLRSIFKTMRKTLTRRQLEEIVLQKVCEMISDSSEIGELKRQILELQQAENHRKLTCFNLEKQIHQLKGVCQVFIEKANSMKKDGRTCTPTMITRSVGLQVTMDANSVSRLPTSTSSSTQQIKNLDVKPTKSPSGEEGRLASSSLINNLTSANISETSIEERNSPSLSKGLNKTSAPTQPVEDSSIIDLTDKEDKSEDVSRISCLTASHATASLPTTMKVVAGAGLKPIIVRPINRHPAPLPKPTIYPIRPGVPHPPPKPELTISRNNDGISLSWNMPLNQNCAKIARYQIYAYQETNTPTVNDPWKPVGEVNALPLPMECTLTQFFTGYRYHFTVRAVDELKRTGPFSEASSIAL